MIVQGGWVQVYQELGNFWGWTRKVQKRWASSEPEQNQIVDTKNEKSGNFLTKKWGKVNSCGRGYRLG